MKPEFLQNFKVGDVPLPKEVIDAILAENGRDVEAAVKPFADYESIKEQLRTATEGLKAFEGVDVKDLQGQVAKLTKEMADQAEAHKQQLADLAFDGTLKDAITAARGRNAKAIRAANDKMDEDEVPREERYLYITPVIKSMLKNAKELTRFLQNGDGAIQRAVSSLEEVRIEDVPSALMKTVYDFTEGWKASRSTWRWSIPPPSSLLRSTPSPSWTAGLQR